MLCPLGNPCAVRRQEENVFTILEAGRLIVVVVDEEALTWAICCHFDISGL